MELCREEWSRRHRGACLDVDGGALQEKAGHMELCREEWSRRHRGACLDVDGGALQETEL